MLTVRISGRQHFVELEVHVFQQTIRIPCEPLKRVAFSFIFSFRYIDYVLSLNNPGFKDYLHQIYPNDTLSSASYLNLNLHIDNTGRLKLKHFDKRDDFAFLIVNFIILSDNTPTSPAYGVHILQLIQ